MYARLSVSLCCTKCLIAQKFQSVSAIMASHFFEGSECVRSNDQLISTFLKFADLAKFEALFKTFGVYKFDHLADVQVEDLHKFGNFKLVLYFVSTLIIFKLGELYFSLLHN